MRVGEVVVLIMLALVDEEDDSSVLSELFEDAFVVEVDVLENEEAKVIRFGKPRRFANATAAVAG